MTIHHSLISAVIWIICVVNPVHARQETSIRDNCIIGAGPAGLQLAHFLEEAGRDYIIFERANVSGDFFNLYPRHGQLISINKRFTGKTNKEFNLRHDWNSLLSNDETLLFKHYSEDFFPKRVAMVKYLNDFQQRLGVKVQFDTNIHNIQKDVSTGLFSMNDQHLNQYSCRYLIIATGLWMPNIPMYDGIEHTTGYESVSTDPRDFQGKTVMILGHGNAAFETADAIYGHTNLVHLVGSSRVKLSWETHYVGDLRGVNNAALDTYQLKSLDGVVEASLHNAVIEKVGDKLRIRIRGNVPDNVAVRDDYDMIIRCLGFKFDNSIFNRSGNALPTHGSGKRSKYPKISDNYEVEGVPDMFVAGTASHIVDFRKSAGGFLHGFRYTARALYRLLEWRNYGTPWPTLPPIGIDQLVNTMVKRVNEASGTYQMFDVLADIILINRTHKTFQVIEEFPVKLIPYFYNQTGHHIDSFFVSVYQYGANYSGPGSDPFKPDRATGDPSNAHKSNFLHPVIYYYNKLPTAEDFQNIKGDNVLPRPQRLHHIVEDFLTSWTSQITHILPLRKFLQGCLNMDLRQFSSENCLKMALTSVTLPVQCKDIKHVSSM